MVKQPKSRHPANSGKAEMGQPVGCRHALNTDADIVPLFFEFLFDQGGQGMVEIPRAVGQMQCAAGNYQDRKSVV